MGSLNDWQPDSCQPVMMVTWLTWVMQ